MDFLADNWVAIAGVVPVVLAALGAIAELTPFQWDNKAIGAIRAIWAKIPIFTRDASKMGTGNPNK